MLCFFSPFHCPPVAQAKSQRPSQQRENMSFQGASAAVPNMAERVIVRQSGKGRICVPQWMMEGCATPHGLSSGRGYVRSPHLGFKLRERPLLFQQETLSRVWLEMGVKT